MTSKVIPKRILCETHPTEIIIKVNLALDSPDNDSNFKIFYCHDCITELPDEDADHPKPNLTKFQDLLESLQQLYTSHAITDTSFVIPPELKDFCHNKQHLQDEVTDQISEQKQRADEELAKIERQVTTLFNTIRSAVTGRFDGMEQSFQKSFNEYAAKIESYQDTSASLTANPESLQNRIFPRQSHGKDQGETSADAEKNLKTVLKEIRLLKEAREEESLEKVAQLSNDLKQVGQTPLYTGQNKNYCKRIEALKAYIEGVLVAIKVDEDEDKKIEDLSNEEAIRQRDLSKEIAAALERLIKEIEKVNSVIEDILASKYTVQTATNVCSVIKEGIKEVPQKAFRCNTCITNYGIANTDYVCAGCVKACHKGHSIESVGTVTFCCECQFKMRDCKLAEDCTYKYTGSGSRSLAFFKCNDDPMGWGQVLCSFCATHCHKDHNVTFYSTGGGYCDCPIIFPNLCIHKKKNP